MEFPKMEKRIEELEKRVAALESKVNANQDKFVDAVVRALNKRTMESGKPVLLI